MEVFPGLHIEGGRLEGVLLCVERLDVVTSILELSKGGDILLLVEVGLFEDVAIVYLGGLVDVDAVDVIRDGLEMVHSGEGDSSSHGVVRS